MTANRAARRQLTLAVVACVVAAGLALFAASRTWVVEVRPRPAPLPAVSVPRTGGDLAPVLPSLAFVALAGASGLVAARGRGRSVVGVLLVAAGVGMAAAAIVGGAQSVGSAALAGGGTAEGESLAPFWAGAGALAGAAVAAVGGLALRRGASWPAMGTAYERRPPRPAHEGAGEQADDQADDQDMWDALDRRIDPTGDNTSRMDD
jgi:uncharacterized membrane protein (TIGR02234 family)